MARRPSVIQIAEIANRLIDPLLQRRAGISSMLIGSWDEIVGGDFADCTRPEKIAWPRRASESVGEEGFQPGTLVIACEGARALFLAHQQDELIARLNGFFGFPAVSRIKIVQKPVRPAETRRRATGPITPSQESRLGGLLGGIDDPKLKQALEKLGRGVMAARKKG